MTNLTSNRSWARWTGSDHYYSLNADDKPEFQQKLGSIKDNPLNSVIAEAELGEIFLLRERPHDITPRAELLNFVKIFVSERSFGSRIS